MNAPDKLFTLPAEATGLPPGVLHHQSEATPFEAHWDRPVRDQELVGLTIDEALTKLDTALLDSVYGH